MKVFYFKIKISLLLTKLMLINTIYSSIEQLYSLNISLNSLASLAEIENLNKPIFELKQMSKLKGIYNKEDIECIPLKYRGEGFWAPCPWDLFPERNPSGFPFPKPHQNPWPGKENFLRRLLAIEALAVTLHHEVSSKYLDLTISRPRIVRYAHFWLGSPSRFEEDVVLGCSQFEDTTEFEDTKEKIRWPSGYRQYYIEKFNVIPSEEFYNYVMNFSEK